MKRCESVPALNVDVRTIIQQSVNCAGIVSANSSVKKRKTFFVQFVQILYALEISVG